MMLTNPVFATRLNSFALGQGTAHPPARVSTIELIRRAGEVKGLTALELNYPEHFVAESVADVKAAMAAARLETTGIQVRWPTADFALGGFTHAAADVRAKAVRLAKDAVDMCVEFGAGHVILWPGHDGYEYPFQLDYVQAWEWLIESYSAVADHNPKIDISIEFKPAEPRARTMLSTTGGVLALIAACDRPNLYVTLDFAHVFMAGENAAQSVALCLQAGKLKGLQLNDGYAKADDGLIVGSVHLVETLEAFFYLVRDGYAGTYYFDTDPIREDPYGECEMNIVRTSELLKIARRLVDEGVALPDSDALAGGPRWWNALVANDVK